MKSATSSLKTKFFASIRWNLVGSIIFETLKFAHQVALLTVVGVTTYGLIGSTFSFMYLTLHLVDFESGISLLPFLEEIKASKRRFSFFMKRYVLFNMMLFFIGSVIGLAAYQSLIFSQTHLSGFLVVGIICTEGLRIFFRLLLQSFFLSKPTVLTDLVATIGYFAAVWLPYYLGHNLTIQSVFLPYFYSSLFAISSMSLLIYQFYLTLPDQGTDLFPPGFLRRVVKTRAHTYITHLSKHFFTGNFLTPLFAVKFGLSSAGLLKFSSYIADGIKSIIKVTIGFSGGAILAQLKNKSLTIKRKVFAALWKTFSYITIPIALFVAINYQTLFSFWFNSKYDTALPSLRFTQPALVISLLLLLISLMENFFLAYEEFYLVEEQTSKLLTLKLLELSLFGGLIMWLKQAPATMLITTVIVRMISFATLIIHSYARWKIKPHFYLSPYYGAFWLSASIAFSFLVG